MKKFLSLFLIFSSIAAAGNLLSVAVPQSGSFTANSIPNLIGWYRSNAGLTLSGSNVTAWADQKASNNMACTNNPTYNATGFNGHPTVNFNGGTAKCQVTTAGNQTPVAVFMVIEPLAGNVQFSNLFSGTNTGTTGSLTFEVGAGAAKIDVWQAGHSPGQAPSGANSFVSNSTYMIGFSYDNNTTITTYIGSSQAAQTSTASTGDFLGATWLVGSTVTGFSAGFYNVSEIAVYSVIPSGGNITNLHTAWVSTYGVN